MNAGGSDAVSVAAAEDCIWSATSNANWITITSGYSGNGNGGYSAAPNRTGVARADTISILGKMFNVKQKQ